MKQTPTNDESSRREREESNGETPLLNLSAELRNKIFALALPAGEVLAIHEDIENQVFYDEDNHQEFECRKLSTRRTYRRAFGLTQVCRQTRQETVKVAYANNTFACHVSAMSCPQWLETRPQEVLPLITKLMLIDGECGSTGIATSIALVDLEHTTFRAISTGACDYCYELTQEEAIHNCQRQYLFSDLTSAPPREKLMGLIWVWQFTSLWCSADSDGEEDDFEEEDSEDEDSEEESEEEPMEDDTEEGDSDDDGF